MSGLGPRGFRFRPPPGGISEETAWALLCAFGPEGVAAGDGGEAAVERAFRLGLAERIWSRRRRDPAAAGIPSAAAARFERAYRAAVAGGLVYDGVAAELAAVAAELGVPLIFLKGHALALAGVQPPGSRPYSDLDVLASEAGGRALAGALAERGWESPPVAANEQHLPALRAPRGGAVEIHFRLRGVRVGASDWADAAAVAAGGELTPVASLPGDCAIPGHGLLAAHLLVHGIDQHGRRPLTYPLPRMIGDLADLLPDDAARREFAARHRATVAGSVSRREMAAALELVARLGAGELPEASAAPAGDAERLLRHLVAGSLDRDYAASLALGHLSSRLGTAFRRGHLGGYLRRKLSPRPGGTLAALGSGIARLGRAAAARLSLAGRRSSGDESR